MHVGQYITITYLTCSRGNKGHLASKLATPQNKIHEETSMAPSAGLG